MAIFNPDVPAGKDLMPNWTKVTSPISSLEVDKSAGLKLAAVGQGIEGTAETADFQAKKYLDKEVRNTVEPIREQYTNDLLQGKAIIQGAGNVTSPDTGDTPKTLINSTEEAPVPSGISSGLSKIDNIEAFMRTGGGKMGVDQTYYDMRLKSAVTDLRARYPGYRDFIDTKVAQITGMNPANELVNDLQRQISQLQSNKKSEFDKEVDIARKAMGELHNGKEMFEQLIQKGEAFLPEWRQWYATESRKWAVIKEREALRQDVKSGEAVSADQRHKDWTNLSGSLISNNMNTILTVAGMNDKKSATDLMADIANNPGKYKDEQVQAFANVLEAQRAQVKIGLGTMSAETHKSTDGKTYSYNSDVGAGKIKETNEQLLAFAYDPVIDALRKGQAGLAYARMQHAKSMLDTTRDEMYSNPDFGKEIQMYRIMQEDMGPAWATIAEGKLLSQNIDKTVNTLFKARTAEGRSQPELKPGGTGIPYTFKDMAGEALDGQKAGKIDAAMRSRYLEGGLNVFLGDITDKSAPDQAKANALRFFFSKNGQGVLNNWKDDYYDSLKNREVPGKQTVWGKMTSDAVVNEVQKLAVSDPSVGTMYRNWIKTEAATQLYMKDFLNLNHYTGHDDLHFKYNDGEKGGVPYITMVDKNGRDITNIRRPTPGVYSTQAPSGDPEYLYQINQSVNRLNGALAGVHRVEKAMGGNASADMLGFLVNAQVNIGKNWTGIPAQIMDAIAASQGKGKLKDVMEQGTK